MDYFWKENKPFVIAVGAGALVFLLWWMFVLSPLETAAAQAEARLRRKHRDLEEQMQRGVPEEDAVAQAERYLEQGARIVGDLTARTAFQVAERFQKPKRERPKPYFDGQRLNLFGALPSGKIREQSVKAGIPFPTSIGMEGEATDDSAGEMLLRLAVTERLAKTAIAAKVERIESIDALHDVGGVMADPSMVPGRFLNRLGVFMRFSGSSEAVFKVLHGVQKEGDYLAVTRFEASRPDPTEDRLEAAIAVALLKIEPDKPIEVGVEE